MIFADFTKCVTLKVKLFVDKIFSFRASNCDRGILLDIMRNDMELTWLVHSLGVKQQWNRIQMIR
jgi:hypothetical protein